ncbi:hypothetical protein AB5J62_18565 [Amycolatopsis sp. cg5]|uniref:hypothetical protein n=1 Tax=Amycolatopsis sp. cg5 TaxID=3238802 RepID=UPI0035235278
MKLLLAERVKLLSTRTPWFCLIGTVAVLLLGSLFAALNTGRPLMLQDVVDWPAVRIGLVVVLVLAALAVTTEYRFGTIRTTFEAVPTRTPALLAKTTVVSVGAAIAGLLGSAGALAVAAVFAPAGSELGLHTEGDWRLVLGVSVFYAVGAVIGVALGVLIRHTAGAVAVMVGYPMIVETMLNPMLGKKAQFSPFNLGQAFLGGPADAWFKLVAYTAIAAALLAVAAVVAKRRDA